MSPHRHPLHVPLPAVLLVIGAVACFAVADAIIKFLTQRYPVPLLVFARWGLQAVVTVIWLAPTMRWDLVRTPQPKLQLLRGTVLVGSSLFFVSALRWLPLADATAINYTTPILVVLLSVSLLKERMTRSRWAFVAVGFAGMLLIARPGASILHGAALLALGAAGCYALFQLLTRKLRGEDPRVTLFYPALCGTVLMTLLLPFLDYRVDMPWAHVGLVATFGAVATLGHFMFILAFRHAPASALTPFTYAQLVWAVGLGWLVFGQFPDAYSLAGIAVIATSGLLLTWHERRQAQALVVTEEPPAVD
jgi:drug/metabolite transporter (DMT)-like permease